MVTMVLLRWRLPAFSLVLAVAGWSFGCAVAVTAESASESAPVSSAIRFVEFMRTS